MSGAKFVKGEQVFENYGQPNHVYFLYHGFSIRNNSHDCVHWNLQLSKSEMEAAKSFESKQLLQVGIENVCLSESFLQFMHHRN